MKPVEKLACHMNIQPVFLPVKCKWRSVGMHYFRPGGSCCKAITPQPWQTPEFGCTPVNFKLTHVVMSE